MTCWCKKEGEKCFFRYNDVYNQNNIENGINHNEIVFTSEYLYIRFKNSLKIDVLIPISLK